LQLSILAAICGVSGRAPSHVLMQRAEMSFAGCFVWDMGIENREENVAPLKFHWYNFTGLAA
jgi:hypothetical protein